MFVGPGVIVAISVTKTAADSMVGGFIFT